MTGGRSKLQPIVHAPTIADFAPSFINLFLVNIVLVKNLDATKSKGPRQTKAAAHSATAMDLFCQMLTLDQAKFGTFILAAWIISYVEADISTTRCNSYGASEKTLG